MRRHPAVAGRFYPGSAEALRKQVQEYVVPVDQKIKALGILSPHAGFIYSGPVAGAVYSRLALPSKVVLIGPNHTGLGEPVSLMSEGSWETPLGNVAIDADLGRAILGASARISEDALAHVHEHSLEVQLPFIQYLHDDFSIVPIQMLDTRLDTCLEVGRAVAEAVKRSQHDVLIVASSDMSHYVTAAAARDQDHKAIDRILQLDAEGLYRTVRENGITMCGYGPAAAVIAACRILGASRSELIKYSNSGDVSGDYDQVVGYAGIIIS